MSVLSSKQNHFMSNVNQRKAENNFQMKKKDWKKCISFSQSLIETNNSKRNEITKQKKQIETKKEKKNSVTKSVCRYFKQGSCTNYTSVKMPILIATYSKQLYAYKHTRLFPWSYISQKER